MYAGQTGCKNGPTRPRVLDLFIALSTIDKCEQTKATGHGRRWFAAAFVSTLQAAFQDQRVWIGTERLNEVDVGQDESQVFLEDFNARKARCMVNVRVDLISLLLV